MLKKIVETIIVWYITFYLLTETEKYHNKPYKLNKVYISCMVSSLYLFLRFIQNRITFTNKCICLV